MSTISWSDFEKIDIRCGTIIAVKDFPKARKPSYQFQVDFGEKLGIKRSSAQVTQYYQKEDLLNKPNSVNHHFLVSDYTESFEASARLFFTEEVHLEKHPLWD